MLHIMNENITERGNQCSWDSGETLPNETAAYNEIIIHRSFKKIIVFLSGLVTLSLSSICIDSSLSSYFYIPASIPRTHFSSSHHSNHPKSHSQSDRSSP